VIPGHLLDQNTAAHILEHNKVPDKVQKPLLLEHAFKHHPKLRQSSVRKFFAFNSPPGHEPFTVGRQCADPRLHAVGDNHRLVIDKERRDLRLVGLKLVESGPDCGVFGGGVLEFHHRYWKAVNEEYYVWTACWGELRIAPALDHGKLIYRKEFVVLRLIIIEHADEIAANRAVSPLIFDRDPLDQVLVNHMVVDHQ